MTNMTIEEKRAMFFDMQEHPDKYTDEQIEELLADDDMQTFIHDMAMTKRAILKAHPKQVDIDAEWKKFAYLQAPRQHRWMKIAAAFIGVIFLSGVALAAVLQLGIFRGSSEKEQSLGQNKMEQIIPKDSSRAIPAIQKDTINEKPVIFENAELGNILMQMTTYYNVKLVFGDESSRHIRLFFNWDKKESLQRNIDLLNGFERINITYKDNTITVE